MGRLPIPKGTTSTEKYAEDKTWNTDQLLEDFVVLGFVMGFCVVRRKSDGQVGSLAFIHYPRLYFDWVPDSD